MVRPVSGYLQSSVQHAEASMGRVRLQGRASGTVGRHQYIRPVPRSHEVVPPDCLQGCLQLQSLQAPVRNLGR